MKDEYQSINASVNIIVERVSEYMNTLNEEYIEQEVWRAYEYAREAHEGQYRLSGEPYISHPVAATLILLDLKPDIFTIQTCLLHDVIEDTSRTQDDIEKVFGKEVAFLCEGLSKLSKVRYEGQERDIGSLRKMFVAMAEDVRVVFVKLSDRLHNMSTLHHHPKPEKQRKIALETLNIYAPIADRLGLHQFKNKLDEYCFEILEPQGYAEMKKQFAEIESERVQFMINAEEKIAELLKGKVEHYEIDYRIKALYSVYKKLKKKGLHHINELFDIFGMRIMVNSEAECYKVLGIIHKQWTPLPKRFKDYIALPKPNGYKSLHTSVMGLFQTNRKQPTEIQIKTFAMKEYADIGVAAHFEYKEKGSKIANDINWVKELKDIVDSLQDNTDFVGSLKVDVFKDRIYVFTPKGDFINLPAGSTPIDFAYAIHSDLGDHITIAKVNSSVYPLDKELHNGDVVEITVDKNKKPNPFWISFVKTVKAKNRIKAFLKKEDKELHRERGRDIMNRYFEKSGLDIFDKDLSHLKVIDGRTLSMEDRYNMLEQVGNFSLPPSALLKKILLSKKSNSEIARELLQRRKVKNVQNKQKIEAKQNQVLEKKQLIIGGQADLDYNICNVCLKKGITKDIVAHINNRGNLTVHKRSCKILDKVNKERLLPAYIDGDSEETIAFEISLIVQNETKILGKILEIFYTMHIEIANVNTRSITAEKTEIKVQLAIPYHDYFLLDRIIERLKLGLHRSMQDYSVKVIE